MLKAGVPLVDALDSVHSDESNALLNRTIDSVIDDVSNGMSLSRAMDKHPKVFNSMFVNIVKASFYNVNKHGVKYFRMLVHCS